MTYLIFWHQEVGFFSRCGQWIRQGPGTCWHCCWSHWRVVLVQDMEERCDPLDPLLFKYESSLQPVVIPLAGQQHVPLPKAERKIWKAESGRGALQSTKPSNLLGFSVGFEEQPGLWAPSRHTGSAHSIARSSWTGSHQGHLESLSGAFLPFVCSYCLLCPFPPLSLSLEGAFIISSNLVSFF